MSNININIYKKIKSLSNQEINITYKLIAEYLLNNIDEIKKIKIKDIVMNTFCSASTVIRFAKNIGYDSFKEFIFEFKNQLEYLETANNYEQVNNEAASTDTTKVEVYFNEHIKNLISIAKNNINTISRINEILKSKTKIFIVGFGTNAYACSYLKNLLLLKGYIVYYSSSIDTTNDFIEEFINENSLIIFISFTFSKEYLLNIFNKITSKGCKTVVISQNKNIISKTSFFIQLGKNEMTIKKRMTAISSIITIINMLCI